jgi:hypothetical protein
MIAEIEASAKPSMPALEVTSRTSPDMTSKKTRPPPSATSPSAATVTDAFSSNKRRGPESSETSASPAAPTAITEPTGTRASGAASTASTVSAPRTEVAVAAV